MKPHLRLKLKPGAAVDEPIPSWHRIVHDKSVARTTFHRPVDEVFARHRIPVWVTREFEPEGNSFSEDEIASGLDRIYRIILQEDREIPAALVAELCLLPTVEYARIGRIGSADLPPVESAALSAQTDRESREAIYLPQAARFSRGHRSVTVAVLDTGVDLGHPELEGALAPGYDFVDIIDGAKRFLGDYLGADDDPADEVGHGTHVAGIIVGKGSAMPDGVVPECTVLPVRVLGALRRGSKRIGAGLIDNISSGIKWAVDAGADVINMSLGVEPLGGDLPHEEVIDYARGKGVSVVAAAGNDGSPTNRYYPAALPYAITVGAVDEAGEVAAFSTYGSPVDFVAPGTEIYSSYLDGRYAFSSGTSQATPFVAGAAALLRSFARDRGRRISDGQIKFVLRNTGDRLDNRFRNRKAGFGRVNLIDAVRLLEHKLEMEASHGS